jgi:hemerythrin-like metal-binding protein
MDSEVAHFLPDSLVLGVPEIDAQHRELFAKLAEIKAICIAENCLPEASADALLAFLHEHFLTEERFAKAAGYDFSRHAAKHEVMITAIRQGIAKVQVGKKDVFGLLKFVEYWFERHITEEDLPLCKILSS